MRVYTYSPAELQPIIGATMPEGTLRLEGPLVERVASPDAADVIVCPVSLYPRMPDRAALVRLPHWRGREDRHVFFDVSDAPDPGHRAAGQYVYSGVPSIFLRCNLRTWMQEAAPNSISFAWPVEDLGGCVDLPEGGFQHDVGFQGWLSSDGRRAAVKSCQTTPGLSLDFATYPDFYGYLYENGRPKPEAVRRKAEHLRSIRECRIQLCPWSIPGVYPYRAWEAMSGGRVPALILSGHVEPFADEVPYADFCLQIPAEKAAEAGPIIRAFLDRTPDAKLVEMGRLARKWWLERMNSARWPELHAYAVEKRLRQLGRIA